jgi:hypothetical protein
MEEERSPRTRDFCLEEDGFLRRYSSVMGFLGFAVLSRTWDLPKPQPRTPKLKIVRWWVRGRKRVEAAGFQLA